MNIRKKSQKQEKRVAKQTGGNLVPASGSLWSNKADVKIDNFLIEVKYTDKDYYTLKVDIWNKIYKEAIKDGGRIALLQIDIKDKEYVILDDKDFIGLGLNKYNYFTQGQNYIFDKKSFRLNNNKIFIMHEYLGYLNDVWYPRELIYFKRDNLLLNLILWDDFLQTISPEHLNNISNEKLILKE